MADDLRHPQESGARANAMERRRRVAWILILIVNVGFVAWGAAAAASPITCSTQVARQRRRRIATTEEDLWQLLRSAHT